MDDAAGFFADRLSAEILKEGVRLILVATRTDNDQWQLSAYNDYGTSTNWLELFSTAQLAIDAGMRAIEQEGVEPFANIDDFDYLF